MATGDHTARELVNETRINVASLLQEPVGSIRSIHLGMDAFLLDDDLFANDLDADVRLIRLRHQVLADGKVRANVALDCVRCLTTFEQRVETTFSEPFLQSHDVRSGADLSDHRERRDDEDADESDEESFVIDEGHEMDLAEALRQNLVLALPMVPSCGDVCPGPPEEHLADKADERGGQFDLLSSLLDDDTDDEESAGSR
ncbi:MAG TPA: DUF177 domain-containing protein [Thermomicrobiales bacterium]|nr:DUF177 domain-containing protein [Thermomicrobiales bacterium]